MSFSLFLIHFVIIQLYFYKCKFASVGPFICPFVELNWSTAFQNKKGKDKVREAALTGLSCCKACACMCVCVCVCSPDLNKLLEIEGPAAG